MKKNTRNIIILLVVLALCIAAYVIISQIAMRNAAKEAAEADSSVITIGDIADAAYIGITNSDTTLEFLNNGDSWIYVQDESFPLDESYMTAIADAAVGLTAQREIDIVDSLSAYGLDSDSGYISVTIIDSANNTFGLQIGSALSDGSSYYARVPNEDVIYVISSDLAEAVSYDLYDMIELESFDAFESTDITSISVTNGDILLVYRQETTSTEVLSGVDEDTGEEIYTENITSAWFDESSGEAVRLQDITTPTALAEAAAGFEFSRCKSYNASDSLLANCGLSDPALEITIAYKDANGADASFTLLIGKADSDGYYWSKLQDSTAVNMIAASCIDSFISAVSEAGDAEEAVSE